MAADEPANRAAIGERAAARSRHWLNPGRIRIYSWTIVAIFGVVLVVWIGLSLPDLVDPRGKPIGYDFMAYWSAARLVLEGRPEAAFDESMIAAVQHAAVPFLPGIVFPWHYPPVFLLAVVPLGLLPYATALAIFILGTAVLWAALISRVLPDRRAWIVAAAAPAGLITLLDGQNAFFTAALAGFALLWLDRRPVIAGVLIGLLAVKPQLAVLFPLALLAEGRWHTIAAAAATVLALVAASLVAFGWETWAVFLDHLPRTQAMAEAGAVPWGTMPTPYAFTLSLGAPVAAARVLQGAAVLFAALCVWRAWRHRDAPFEAKAATLVTASLLVSPVLFYYDLLWAALAIAWLALLGLKSGFRGGEREILLFAWLAPALMPPVQLLTSVQLGFPAVLLLLFVAVGRAASPSDPERRPLRQAIDAVRTASWITRERVMRWGIGFAVLSAMVMGGSVALNLTSDVALKYMSTDFANYWAAARLAIAGQASVAYDLAGFDAFEKSVFGPTFADNIYGYPPLHLLLTLPFAVV
ncbi:MAG TPA: glycosyltransferase family 87 protein, partial [Stellaceae bacterium]|nr:glycosyltransferase family 87 protein [Stellaceae bacterium]